ncbi:hypothetical protein ACFOY2_48430 [Nonomuraea purpurea]|uniref:DUF2029 domain-containing protein n=1 Tax=Nonomuraea purpurea TaxID=1849276 RepID=A0ABV8GQG7_9ACTN
MKKAIARLEIGLIVAGLIAIAVLRPHGLWGDGGVRYTDLTQLLTTGAVPDGKYSMIGPLFSAPLWLAGQFWDVGESWVAHYNDVVFALGLLAFYWLLRDRMPREILRTFLLLLVFASMFAKHLTLYYGEVFTAVLVAVGTIAVVTGRRGGWVAIVTGVANTPASLAGLGFLALRRAWDTRRVWCLAAIFAAGGLVLAEAWIRRGSPFLTGYEGRNQGFDSVMPYSGLPGFSYPLLFGLLSLLLSFGKGLVFFAPGLFLPVRERLKDLPAVGALYGMWLAFTVGLILLYANYWAWSGAHFWGPRYLLFASLPACLVLAVRAHRPYEALLPNVLTLVALALSIWVGVSGAVFGDIAATPAGCRAEGLRYEEALCYYTPEFSALWYPFVAHPTLDAAQVTYLVFGLAVGVFLLARPALVVFREVYGRGLAIVRSR